MLLNPDLQDAYPAADGSLHRGEQQVNDGVLELDARVDGGEGRLVLRLVEAGDTFEVALEPLSPGGGEEARAHAVLTRRTGTDSVATAAEAGLAFARGTWHRLRFANVDNHVSFAIDGRVVLAFDYEANVPWLGHDQAGTHTGALLRSIGPRVAFGAEGLTASFRDVRVARDLFWVPEGLRAVDEPFELGPDEYFVLGDNSAHSNDGRHFGPARASQVLGRPVAVLWPPRAIRRLRGPEPPASEPRP
jgi:hypothetical protein